MIKTDWHHSGGENQRRTRIHGIEGRGRGEPPFTGILQ